MNLNTLVTFKVLLNRANLKNCLVYLPINEIGEGGGVTSVQTGMDERMKGINLRKICLLQGIYSPIMGS